MTTHNLSVQLPATVAGLITEAALDRYGKLLTGDDFCPSGKSIKDRLADLTPGCLFESPVNDLAMADGCLSGLWLLHGFLYESHEISQSLKTPEGSFWHGIMHRIETDFSNSQYWYRQVGSHQVIDSMIAREANYPNGFVDACERAHESGGAAEVADVAIIEWISLFEHCYKNAC